MLSGAGNGRQLLDPHDWRFEFLFLDTNFEFLFLDI
jgi:hypothetical protein